MDVTACTVKGAKVEEVVKGVGASGWCSYKSNRWEENIKALKNGGSGVCSGVEEISDARRRPPPLGKFPPLCSKRCCDCRGCR